MGNNILLQPVVSEKSYTLANADNKYTFVVEYSATKIDITKEVEKKYKVKVVDVNIVTKPGKLKKDWVKFKKYRKGDLKKAIVKLKKGDKIAEFLNI